MEATGGISEQVERFEDFCIRKRALEGGIEVVLAKRDAKAVLEVVTAERVLASAKGECERITARVTRARQGDFETTQGHQMPTQYVFTTFSAPQPNGAGATTLPHGPSDAPTRAQADSQKATNNDQRTEDDLSNEFLDLLVQRYTDLCHERQLLQEEIEDRLERKERLATEKLRCAKIQLEKIREQAAATVAALNEASGGDTRVRLPIGARDETYIDSKSAHSSGPLPLTVSPSFPPAAGSTLAAPLPNNTSSGNTVPTTAVCSCPLPNPPRGTTIDHLTDLISEIRRTPTTPATPAPPIPPSSNVTATQQAIFKRYDELIKLAKAAGASVPIPGIPWPLLVSHAHQYPMQNVMEKHLVNLDVVRFVHLYSQWKGWNLLHEGRAMREDWEKLLSAIPEHKRGGRACVAKVVSILRELVPGT